MKVDFSRPVLTIGGWQVVVVWEDLTTPHGGCRPWFSCPSCSRPVRFLYFGDSLACRRCGWLDYPSRHLHRSVPQVHRIRRLRERIGIDPRPFAAIPERPRHHVRYWRTVARIKLEEAGLIDHLSGITSDLARRRRVRGW